MSVTTRTVFKFLTFLLPKKNNSSTNLGHSVCLSITLSTNYPQWLSSSTSVSGQNFQRKGNKTFQNEQIRSCLHQIPENYWLFRTRNFSERWFYSKCWLDWFSLPGDSEVERKVLLQAGRLNLCQCYLKLGKWIEARNVCDKVLI